MRRGMSFAAGALLVIAFVAAFAVASRPDAASPSDAATTRGAKPASVQRLHAVAALPLAFRVAAPSRPQSRAAQSRRDEARARAARSRRHEARSRAAQPRRHDAPSPARGTGALPPAGSPVPTTTSAPAATPRPVVTASPPVAAAPAPKPKPKPRFDSSGGFESEG
jgi:cell division septation protein DedD